MLRLKQVQAGHLGDVKSVGGGLSELRWHMGPGYRVYFCKSGDQIILLLSGGDKSTLLQQELNRGLIRCSKFCEYWALKCTPIHKLINLYFAPNANCNASWLCLSINGPISTVAISPLRTTTRPLTMV